MLPTPREAPPLARRLGPSTGKTHPVTLENETLTASRTGLLDQVCRSSLATGTNFVSPPPGGTYGNFGCPPLTGIYGNLVSPPPNGAYSNFSSPPPSGTYGNFASPPPAGIYGNFPCPPPTGIYYNFASPLPTVYPNPPGQLSNIPLQNYIAERISNMPVETQQGILKFVSDPQNLQQVLSVLHSLGQHPSAFPSLVPTWPIDSSWFHCLPSPLLRNPVPLVVVPKPINYLDIKPPLPSLFLPLNEPGHAWPQSSTPVTASSQPNSLTRVGRKRRFTSIT